MDSLGIKIKVLELGEAAYLEVSKSKVLSTLDSKAKRHLEEVYLEELLTRQINHRIIKVGYLELNNNNQQLEDYKQVEVFLEAINLRCSQTKEALLVQVHK
jgi:hypothetical protein